MSPVDAVHQKLGVALLLVLLGGAVLAATSIRRPALLPAARAYAWLCAATVGLEAILGLAVLATGGRPHDGLHLLYAVLTLAAVPTGLLLAGRGDETREALVIGAGFVMAGLLAVRALLTGGG